MVKWPDAYSYATYGNSNDLWSTTLTPVDINSNNFGVAIATSLSVTNLSILGVIDVGLIDVSLMSEIDAISMTVHYNVTDVVLPITLHSFKARLLNNSVLLNWSLAEQEEHCFVTLQRSLNHNYWQDIYQQPLHNTTELQSYQFLDKLIETGEYAYRVKLTAPSGKITYSPVENIRFKNSATVDLYPNPAQSVLNISLNERISELSVTNWLQQKIKVPIVKQTDHSIQMNVEQLPAGLYFVHTGKQVVRFVKQ